MVPGAQHHTQPALFLLDVTPFMLCKPECSRAEAEVVERMRSHHKGTQSRKLSENIGGFIHSAFCSLIKNQKVMIISSLCLCLRSEVSTEPEQRILSGLQVR